MGEYAGDPVTEEEIQDSIARERLQKACRLCGHLEYVPHPCASCWHMIGRHETTFICRHCGAKLCGECVVREKIEAPEDEVSVEFAYRCPKERGAECSSS